MALAPRPDPDFDALVEGLYDAAVGTHDWRGLAPRLAEAFGASSAVLKIQGVASVELLDTTDNLVIAPHAQAWADHWHRQDLWVERSLALGPRRIVTSQELLPEAEFERSGYYQDWTRRLGIFHMIGSVLPLDTGHTCVIGIHRPRSAAPFATVERQRMARLLPHLQRAMRLRVALAPARLDARGQLAALDRLGTAAVILDAHARLLHANPRGEACLGSSAGLSLRFGRVQAETAAFAPRWRVLLQRAVQGVGGAMTFARPGRMPLTVLAAPMPGDSGTAIVLIRDPEVHTPARALLIELFGFTATEAAVAGALAEGLLPDEIAQRLGIGLGTVRTHLKQALAKTGTHRQAQLVALMTRSVAMLGQDP